MSGIPNPNNVAPANVGADELPDGFSLGSGPGSGGGSSAAADQSAQRDAQRQAILEQAMTADALARLRRVKVGKLCHLSVFTVNDAMSNLPIFTILSSANILQLFALINFVWHCVQHSL